MTATTQYNKLQSSVLSNIINQPSLFLEFGRLAGDAPEAYFINCYKVFYKAVDLVSKNGTINLANIKTVVDGSKAGKEYTKAIETIFNELSNARQLRKAGFLAKASRMVYFMNTHKAEINTGLVTETAPPKRGMTTEAQLNYLRSIRKKTKLGGWLEIKNELGITSTGLRSLTKREASQIIDYWKAEVAKDEK
jgi:hypothetical protein